MLQRVAYWQHHVDAVQRFADHTRVARGGCSVWFARPHNYSRQTSRTSVYKTLSGVIVNQELAHCLRHPVGGHRSKLGVVRNKRERAEDGAG